MIEENEQDTVHCWAHFIGSVLKVVGMDTKTRGEDAVWSYQISQAEFLIGDKNESVSTSMPILW